MFGFLLFFLFIPKEIMKLLFTYRDILKRKNITKISIYNNFKYCLFQILWTVSQNLQAFV